MNECVDNNIIPVPVTDHHRVTDTQTMYIDIFFVCTLPYLITKVQLLDHIVTSLFPEISAIAIKKAFLRHIGFYSQRGIRISALFPIMNKDTSLGLQFGGTKIVLT